MDIQELREKAIKVVKAKLRESVGDDLLIIQTISGIDELDKAINLLSKRLRERYELYNPEISKAIPDHETFAKTIISKSKKELLTEFSIGDAMGADLKQKDIDAIMALANEVNSLFEFKESQGKYLEEKMKELCPNITAIAGTQIGAKLIALAGSLRRLSMFPASTIQLLGAEKALFRHLRNRRNLPPKYGILHEHVLVNNVPQWNKGKMARTLADKISIAAKVDYFKGKFVGKVLSEQVEKKCKELQHD